MTSKDLQKIKKYLFKSDSKTNGKSREELALKQAVFKALQ